MATRLEKTLRRELSIGGRPFMLTISPEGLKLTLKGHQKGQELRWADLASGEAALAVALNASVGRFERPRDRPRAAQSVARAPAPAPPAAPAPSRSAPAPRATATRAPRKRAAARTARSRRP